MTSGMRKGIAEDPESSSGRRSAIPLCLPRMTEQDWSCRIANSGLGAADLQIRQD